MPQIGLFETHKKGSEILKIKKKILRPDMENKFRSSESKFELIQCRTRRKKE